MIIKKIYKIYFNEDWQYSNGCTLEFAIATKKGIPRLDDLDNPLDSPTAIVMIEQAVADLKQRGIATDRLEHNLALLRGLVR